MGAAPLLLCTDVMAPCFLLRDGRKQLFDQVPDGLALHRYQDQAGLDIQALLDPASQQRLLGAQPKPQPQPSHNGNSSAPKAGTIEGSKLRPLRRPHPQSARRSA